MVPANAGEEVVLVHVNFPAGNMEEDLAEFKALTLSSGARIASIITGQRHKPEAKYFVGTGKAQEIFEAVHGTGAQLVIFNHVLSPAQERNLERLIKCRVIDRNRLILAIFAQRARSFEGKLQVELAQLQHLSTRLVRGWTHLERQRGGIGLRGPGETQLETDRRLIRNRIKNISQRLEKLRKQRMLARRARRKAIIPTVALVGYTNAGKSTLFNRLTGATAFVADQPFATLDPTLRRAEFPESGPLILADTVGFIRHLPPDLIEAFHATLEEVIEADILLHVIDAFSNERQMHIQAVNQVLKRLGAEQIPTILVFNKIDLCKHMMPSPDQEERHEPDGIKKVFVSAKTGLGIEELPALISKKLGKDLIETQITLIPEQAKLRAKLYQQEAVLAENVDELGNHQLVIRMPRVEFEKIFR